MTVIHFILKYLTIYVLFVNGELDHTTVYHESEMLTQINSEHKLTEIIDETEEKTTKASLIDESFTSTGNIDDITTKEVNIDLHKTSEEYSTSNEYAYSTDLLNPCSDDDDYKNIINNTILFAEPDVYYLDEDLGITFTCVLQHNSSINVKIAWLFKRDISADSHCSLDTVDNFDVCNDFDKITITDAETNEYYNSTLTLNHLTKKNSGFYFCKVRN